MTNARLSMRDVYAGLLVAAAVALVIAWHVGSVLPGMGSPRMLGVGVLVLGIAGCATGSDRELVTDRAVASPVVTALTEIGVVTLILALVAIAVGSELLVAATAGLTALLWVAATVRHTLRPAPVTPPVRRPAAQPPDRTPVGV